MKKVILIIGNRFQPNACGFIQEFEKLGGKIDGILCLLPTRNLKYYLKKPFRILKRLKPSSIKAGIRSFASRINGMQKLEAVKGSWNNTGENSWDLLETRFDIFEYAQQKDIPLHVAPSLTSEVVRSLTKDGPVIFPTYGGGIISKKILDDPNAEFINAHMGEMPRYRGMNVMEWAVLEDQPTKVAVMTMNEAIDGGDVIWHKEIRLDREKSIADLRKTGYEHCYKAMAEGIFKYLADENLRQKQSKGAKYYYRMHGLLRNVLENKLPQEQNSSQ